MRVALWVIGPHEERVILSGDLSDADAKEWLTKIDAAMATSGVTTLETDWATVAQARVGGAWLQEADPVPANDGVNSART